ncbi:glycosyltransferase [Thermomonospora cellulosilytica]|uniref:Glycosyltransferase involved in cell wall biosynthesis n=1 Tax=Thermomonospora cellulosilytica TaxID=1411118 RepID=A0A7W3RAP6_9ACTN|nr:glycosyltransferase [Thermomonospora cellulosilytica]MBA9006107.1 glycosyltransferase involved in cell wall biosynthesis [Thermomonospora cellulosilytica]
MWHVHGSYMTAFVQGPHTYLIPVTPDRGPDGRGRARTWDWPPSAVEVPLDRLRDEEVDVVVLQRPHEEELVRRHLGRRPGRDVPAVYLEHDAPWGDVPLTRHPMADRPDLLLVHVTHFNKLFWDNGTTPARVVEHGVVDPGPRWTGEIAHAAVVVNEPLRRGRYVGTDLLPFVSAGTPLDVFGMRVTELPGRLNIPAAQAYEDLPQHRMHEELARRRAYLHPVRWTSLGLSLLEAMHLSMPVVALATTEVVEAVPPGAGVLSTNPDVLAAALRRLMNDPAEAAEMGKKAREAALERYGLARFLDDWDRVLTEATW